MKLGPQLEFRPDSLEAMADYADKANQSGEDIGARRLHTIMEKLLEDISFEAPEMRGANVVVTAQMVRERLESIIQNEDASRFIL